MADARRLIAAALLAVAARAVADERCGQERGPTGMTLAPAAGGLAVAAVDEASAAARAGVRPGDVVVQVNGVVPHGCGDWSRALRDARRTPAALLLLVRRPDGDAPLAVVPVWTAPAVAAAPAPPPPPPTVDAVVSGPRPPLPASTSVEDVVRALRALGADGDRPDARDRYGRDVARLRGDVEALRARGDVPAPVVTGLDTVLRYHEAAALAWNAEEAERERSRRPRRLPPPEAMPAPFFDDSPEAAAIAAFPFLRETVIRAPAAGAIGESAGLWRPLLARRLLRERVRGEEERLAGWLGMAAR